MCERQELTAIAKRAGELIVVGEKHGIRQEREEEDCAGIGTIIGTECTRQRGRDVETRWVNFVPFQLSYEYVIKPSEF